MARSSVVSVLVSAYLGALGLVVSAFTGRKAIAVGIIIVALLFSSALAGVLQEVFGSASQKAWFALISPARTVSQFVLGIWGQHNSDGQFGTPLDTWVYGAAMVVIVLDLLRNHVLALCSRRLDAHSRATLLRIAEPPARSRQGQTLRV